MIAGLRAADGADTSKIGRQLPLAPAWTANVKHHAEICDGRVELHDWRRQAELSHSELGKLLPSAQSN